MNITCSSLVSEPHPRQIAIVGGHQTYIGATCSRGHSEGLRYTKSRSCVACGAEDMKARWAKNKAVLSEAHSKWRAANSDSLKRRYKKYYDQNREALNAAGRAWKKENSTHIIAYKRTYNQKHSMRIKLYYQQRYAENKEHFKEQYKKWAAANPEKVNALVSNRRARLVMSRGSHTGDQIRALYERQRGVCVNCRKSLRKSYHKDHIHPLLLGGGNAIRNIQLLCPPCNIKKKAKDPLAWARENGRLL